MYLRDDRGPPATPQFALRIAMLGGLALAMFSVIFFRLWYLQVLSGDKYLKQANNNRIRDIRVQAPRGEIVDRNGKVLVNNRTGLALQILTQRLPHDPKQREREFSRLGVVIQRSPAYIRKQIREQEKISPNTPVTLRQDINYDVVYYLQENQTRFPGVTVQRIFLRQYTQGDLAAHLFGYVGQVTKDQLKQPRYRTARQGDEVGQSGVEYEYDRFLRGHAGVTKVQVDALGRPKGELGSVAAKPGDNLQLTIDSDVQRAGESALASRGLPGAFVTMDVQTGEILGMASYPTFDPSVFTHPLTPARYKALTSPDLGAPLANRATQGLYPTGSTFKLITSTAALESGTITPDTTLFDGGTLQVGGISFHNAGGGAYGALQLPSALQVSSDVFFYQLGERMNTSEEPLQHWAHELGIGRKTGIDLPAESGGLLPTPQWRDKLYKQHQTDRPWTVGDNINLAVGQGDLQADPLQMATAYAAIANGGTIVTPHLGDSVDNAAGQVVEEIRPAPKRHLDIKPEYRQAILAGLHMAAQSPGGTSYKVFGGFPIPVAGKTGTAERPGQADQSWYVVFAPYPNPRIVTAVTIERGGFGADAAAPAAEEILSRYFQVRPGQVKQTGTGGRIE
jgi:penicillin-binding protein 2